MIADTIPPPPHGASLADSQCHSARRSGAFCLRPAVARARTTGERTRIGWGTDPLQRGAKRGSQVAPYPPRAPACRSPPQGPRKARQGSFVINFFKTRHKLVGSCQGQCCAESEEYSYKATSTFVFFCHIRCFTGSSLPNMPYRDDIENDSDKSPDDRPNEVHNKLNDPDNKRNDRINDKDNALEESADWAAV